MNRPTELLLGHPLLGSDDHTVASSLWPNVAERIENLLLGNAEVGLTSNANFSFPSGVSRAPHWHQRAGTPIYRRC